MSDAPIPSPPSPPNPYRSALHLIVLDRLHTAFGTPNRHTGTTTHWALRSMSYIASVNVLFDGGGDQPVVWVFNPHDPSNGVSNTTITRESEIDGIIQGIETSVRTAGRPPRH